VTEYFPGLAGLHPPRMLRVSQRFDRPRLESISETVASELARPDVLATLEGKQTVALAVGSRGISGIPAIVRATVSALRRHGRDVFIVPSMGSHGGATAEGQQQVLAHFGVTEEAVGAPVRSGMDVVEIGSVRSGHGRSVPLYMDAIARNHADAVIPINRIKPHTGFRGPVESGLCKMLAIGLGKHAAAGRLHREGYVVFDRLILDAGRAILEDGRVPFGIAIVENAYEETARVEAVPAAGLIEREQELLEEARRLMPRIWVPDIDVLVIEQFGKDVSGVGMDPNVTGRGEMGQALGGFDGPRIGRIAVLDLTGATGGNAHGIGHADVITERLLDRIDRRSTWTNSITAGSLACGRIPPALPTDDQAIMAAAGAIPGLAPEDARIVRIHSTLTLTEIAVSENLRHVVAALEDCEEAGDWDGTWRSVEP
jgi:hypothetical protein